MKFWTCLLFGLLLLSACAPQDEPPAPASSEAVVFEGARLIVGDENAPIDNAVFVVENGRFSAVGAAGAVTPPAGAARVDLSGKTVMPGIVDSHVHLGYRDVTGMTDRPANFSRENVVDHLRRAAHYGVVAALSMGIDRGEIAFELRANPVAGAARMLTAGRGIARPNASVGAADRRDVAYGVDTPGEGRVAVRELAERDVDMVKIWVDDRGGTVPKLTPDLYGPIIAEAQAHGLKVAAHIFHLEDAKELLRAGIHGFAHGVRDRVLDEEFMALLAERPDVFLIPNLPERGPRTEADFTLAGETLPEAVIESMREEADSFEIDPEELFEVQANNLVRMQEAGATIAFGTDGDGAGWDAHEEMLDMVAAGMTPADVIVAATSTSAELLELDDLGTIESGKSADFIVLDANPLDDIANTRAISSVYIRGEPVNRSR